MRQFKIIGHRGACAHEPENTLRSIRRAIADGADLVEIDVRFAAGEIFVIHDATLDRTTDGCGPIYAKSYEEIRALDAGRGEPIPTLAEVLAVTLPRLPLNIEIKDVAVTAAVCQLLAQLADLDPQQILISSFDAQATREVRRQLPKIPIGILAHDTAESVRAMFEAAEELDAASVHPHVRSVDRQLVETAHARNRSVLPYTARTATQLAHLLDCGADGCFADDPKWAANLATAGTRSRPPQLP